LRIIFILAQVFCLFKMADAPEIIMPAINRNALAPTPLEIVDVLRLDNITALQALDLIALDLTRFWRWRWRS
jgi:hypothetical protein